MKRFYDQHPLEVNRRNRRNRKIIAMHKMGYSVKDIAQPLKLSCAHVSDIIRTWNDAGDVSNTLEIDFNGNKKVLVRRY
jgi:transposase